MYTDRLPTQVLQQVENTLECLRVALLQHFGSDSLGRPCCEHRLAQGANYAPGIPLPATAPRGGPVTVRQLILDRLRWSDIDFVRSAAC